VLFAENFIDKTPRELTELDKTLKHPSVMDVGRAHYAVCAMGDVLCWGLNENGQVTFILDTIEQVDLYLTEYYSLEQAISKTSRSLHL